MRFNIHTRAGVISMLAVGIFSIATFSTNKLGLYIHPRYFVFTVVMSILAILLLLLGRLRADATSGFSALISLISVGLLLVPPAVLSSRLADTRAGSGTLALTSNPERVVVTSRNSEKLKFEDWASLLAQDPSGSLVMGKKVKVSGFVRASDNATVLALSRFVVTCCAVDARPIEIPVELPSWQNSYPVDSWVEVVGMFEQQDGRIVLMPSQHYAIEEPESPYAY